MSSDKRKNNPKRSYFKFSVGKLLGLLMASYFIFTFISIRGRTQVNYYEVEEGSLVKEHTYTGLIIREETIVNTDVSGSIYYYVADGRKVASGNPVYTMDRTGDIGVYLNTHESSQTDTVSPKVNDIRNKLLSDSRSFSATSFNFLYDIDNSLRAGIAEYSGLGRFSRISDELKASGITVDDYYAPQNGTVCCYTDGFEDIRTTDLNMELFDLASYQKQVISAGDIVQAGNPAYKLITDENWIIAFPLTNDDIAEFSDNNSVRISFTDKNFSTAAPFSIIHGSDGNSYGIIDMNSFLVQFTGSRFIEFEIVTNDVSGLKIPDIAITEKNFYVIPRIYHTEDDAGNDGFYKAVVGENGTQTEFVITDVYSIDDDYCYIECTDSSPLQAGDFVSLPPGAGVPQTDAASGTPNAGGTASTVSTASGQPTDADLRSQDLVGNDDADVDDPEDAFNSGRGSSSGDESEDNISSGRSDSSYVDGGSTGRTDNSRGEDLQEDVSGSREDSGTVNGSNADRSEGRSGTGAGDGNNLSGSGDSSSTDSGNAENGDVSDNDDIGGEQASYDQGDAGGYTYPSANNAYGLYQINMMKPLEGVYNINKGYTVFRKVEILENANGYSIVKKNTEYGLSTYDHIVLDASQVGDDQLIYR